MWWFLEFILAVLAVISMHISSTMFNDAYEKENKISWMAVIIFFGGLITLLFTVYFLISDRCIYF